MVHATEEPRDDTPDQAPPPTTADLPETEIRQEIAKRAGLLASFSFAIDGVLRTLNSQRNMQIHWVSGTAVMMVGMALNLNIASRASVIVCVFLVLTMEVLNTALEAFVDLHVRAYAKEALIAKDAAAAAVLVLAVGAVVVFADTLFHAWRMVMSSGEAVLRTVLLGVPILAIEGSILGMKRRMAAIIPLGVVAVCLLTVLAWFSRDEIFSLGALTFLVGAAWARFKEPDLQVPASTPGQGA